MGQYSYNNLSKQVKFTPDEQAQADNSERLYWEGQAKYEQPDIAKAQAKTGDVIQSKSNVFDQFDEKQPIASQGNVFDQFDIPQQNNAPQAQANSSDGTTEGYHLSNIIPNAKNLVKNSLAGFARGAGELYSAPVSVIQAALSGAGTTGGKQIDKQRKQDMTDALGMMGADTNSGAFKTGEFVGELAGTAGTGNILAKGAKAPITYYLGNQAPNMVTALKSGGMTLGGTTGNAAKDWAIRSLSGGANGLAVGAMTDPQTAGVSAGAGAALPVSIGLAGLMGKVPSFVTKHYLGGATVVGSETVSQAYKSGQLGKTAFLDNIRGNAQFDDIVNTAKQGLDNMRANRANLYKSGMINIGNDKTVLNFQPIEDALNNVQGMGSYKGVQINKNAKSAVDDVADIVNQWKSLNPTDYHTPEGLDALKKAIGDIRDTTQFGTAARKAVDSVYNSVKDEITKQAPIYSKVMKDYSEASDLLGEIEHGLSIKGDKTKADTAIRKLQSIMRNNVSTNYGNRTSLVNQLEQQGNVDLMPSIAGQAMNSWTPRGMTGAIEKGILPFAVWHNPMSLLAIPTMSPRLVGEAAYKAGQLTSGTKRVAGSLVNKLGLLPKGGAPSLPNLNYIPLSTLLTQTATQ